MFLTGPGVVREALGEEIDAAGLGGPKVHDRNGVCHLVERDEARRRRAGARAARLPALGRRRDAAAWRAPTRPRSPTRARSCRPSRAAHTTSATRSRGIVDARLAARAPPRAGRATSSRRSPGSTGGRSAIVANQPRYLGGVLDAAGSEKAARFVNFCDSFGAAADRGRRHARVHAGLTPGAGRRDPPRRLAGARVRRGARAEADRGAAQVLRRRVHHDELARPRLRPGARVARRRAGDHERPGRGRDRQPPRADARQATPRPSATGWRAPTPTSTCARETAAAGGFIDEIVEPCETRERLAWALTGAGEARTA